MTNNIPCEICMDLIPLVQDGVASSETQQAVAAHTAHCPRCRALLVGDAPPLPQLNDRRVLGVLRQKFALGALLLIVLGTVLGVGLSESMGVFYNVLIMPAIGALGYVALRKKSFVLPIALFVSVYLTSLVQMLTQEGFHLQAFRMASFWPLIYGCLCAVGTIIAALLHFAFKKEDETDEP